MAIVRSLLSPGLSLVTDRQWRQNSSLESEIVNVGERSYGRRVSPRHNPALEAKAIAERLAHSLAARGALAVALVGSHATGDATAESDLDLAVVGEGPHYRLEVHNGLLVSLGWATAEEQHRRLYDPVYLGTHVTGWREAREVRPLLDDRQRAVVEQGLRRAEMLTDANQSPSASG
jgi:predicted nucleotidyltransferase